MCNKEEQIRLHGMAQKFEALGCWFMADFIRRMMLLSIIMIVGTLLTGCGKTNHGSDEQEIVSLGNVNFTQGKTLNLNGARVVDSSLIGGTLYYDFEGGEFFAKSDELIDDHSHPEIQVNSVGLNFTYVMAFGGSLYRFGERGNDIYLDVSLDGISWASTNGGRPVIEHSSDPNSDWNQLWNVGADVDASGVWHIMIECSDVGGGQSDVGLCYAKGNLNGFARVNQKMVISHGGNPFVKAMPEGLLVVHGTVYSPYGPFGNEWYITASTLKNGDAKFITHTDKFALGTPGIHDCDPHLALLDGGLTMVFSVDQSHLQTATTNLNFEQFYKVLTGEN